MIDPADEFCRLACLTYTSEDGPDRWAKARRLLAERPELTEHHIWAAAAASRPEDVGRLIAERPGLATESGGPFGWRPLCYLAYSRVDPTVSEQAVLDSARLLLAAGADPNDRYLIDGVYVFTLLTGAFGAGELGSLRQPPHPHALALARLLLDNGADPNDSQALYNRMFSANDEHLELLFEYGLGRGDLAGDLVRTQLRWAVEHNQPNRVRLLVENGTDFLTPYQLDGPVWSPADGRTPVELAVLNGNTEIAGYLTAKGAPPPDPNPVDDLIAAALRLDKSTVDSIRAEQPDVVAEARRARPGLMVWAAAHAPGAVELLSELGFDVNALGRADAPVEQEWETALHHSAGNGDVALTRRLLALGADPTIRDRRFDGTPVDWARHFHHQSTIDLFGGE